MKGWIVNSLTLLLAQIRHSLKMLCRRPWNSTSHVTSAHALVYIAGYVAFKCASKVACAECKCALVTDRDLTVDEVNTDIEVDISYVQHISCGGLKYPSYLVVLCGYRVQVLLSRKYEEQFLKVQYQRKLLCALSKECLVSVELSTAEVCSCSSSRLSLFTKCVRVFDNIFLNNYTKVNKVSGPSIPEVILAGL